MADVDIATTPAGTNPSLPSPGSSSSPGVITSLPPGTTGASADIINAFLSFGYYPTQAEVASFTTAEDAHGGGAGETGAAQALTAGFIGDYVSNMQAEQQREATDPLAAYAQQAQTLAQQQQTQSSNLYSQAQSVLQSAPQLFGNLSQDQISQYLAPLQTAFTTAQSQTQAQLAARGLTGSNIEANALETGNTNFQNQVLQTGLQIGQTSQTNVANSLQTQAQGLQGASNSNLALQGQATGQISSQNLAQQNYLQSLPYLYGQTSIQDEATRQALTQASNASAGGGGIGSALGGVAGLGLGLLAAPATSGASLLASGAIGSALGSSLGGGIGNAISPGTTGVQPGYSAGLPSALQTLALLKQSQPQTTVPNYTGPLSGGSQPSSTSGLTTSNNQLLGTGVS